LYPFPAPAPAFSLLLIAACATALIEFHAARHASRAGHIVAAGWTRCCVGLRPLSRRRNGICLVATAVRRSASRARGPRYWASAT